MACETGACLSTKYTSMKAKYGAVLHRCGLENKSDIARYTLKRKNRVAASQAIAKLRA
jgi:hypothetical protein